MVLKYDCRGGAGAVIASNSTGNSSNAGVSPLDIAAAASDTLTPANTPTTNDSLGLDIECVTLTLIYILY